jgi:hypothetical protein
VANRVAIEQGTREGRSRVPKLTSCLLLSPISLTVEAAEWGGVLVME